VFFPLSVKTGPSTRRLAAARDDGTRVYALDSGTRSALVVRTVDEPEGRAFTVAGELLVGEAPAAIAAFADGAGAVTLYVALPDESALQILALDSKRSAIKGEARIPLPRGARPVDVAIDPTGDAVVIADAALPQVHVVRRAEQTLYPSIDVGGPTSRVSVGRVDPGDGIAPVALALRIDAPEIAVIRLFRPDQKEDRYALLGRAEVPGTPLAGYVPDVAAGETPPTVCCRTLDADAYATESTRSWAAVATADGNVYYVTMRAAEPLPVRLVDDDPLGPELPLDPNTAESLWTPAPGGEALRPIVTAIPSAEAGDPPIARFALTLTALTLTWEGLLAELPSVPVSIAGNDVELLVRADTSAARAGDVAIVAVASDDAACPTSVEAPVVAARAGALTVDTSALSAATIACVGGARALRLQVRAIGAFAVVDDVGEPRGRLAFDGADTTLVHDGFAIAVAPSAGGPPLRDSALGVVVDPHFEPVRLFVSDPKAQENATAGFGAAALQPSALVGGEIRVPDGQEGSTATIPVRRMWLTTIARLFTFNEGETTVSRVADLR